MAEEQEDIGTGTTARQELLAEQILETPPLEVDDEIGMNDVEHAAQEDIEMDAQRHQRPTRTLFHHRRGDDDTINSTRSLYDTDVVYFEIHGRRYCKNYYMPNDVEEQERCQMLNGIFYTIFGERLTLVPLTNPEKILDIGTGTGEWAMSMGDEYPDAEIIGTDIAKIQPSAVPMNVFFEIDDAEEEGGWTRTEDDFDMVHIRYMCGAFEDWKHIYNESFKHLKPGGWIEVVDFDDHKGMMTYFEEGSEVPRWLAAVKEASEKSGRPRTVEHLQPAFLSNLGFEDVKVTDFDIPIGTWRKDEEGQSLGRLILVTQTRGYEPLCLRLLTEQLGWSYEDIKRFQKLVIDLTWKTALDPVRAKGLYFRVKVLTGRKPGGPPLEEIEDGSSSRTMTMTETNSRIDTINGEPAVHGN